MWTNFINHALDKLEYNKRSDKVAVPKDKYMLISNPFTKDHCPSSAIYSRSGLMRLYNSSVEGKDKLEIYEWTKMLGLYEDYVSYLAKHYELSHGELLSNKHLCEMYKISDVDRVQDIDFTVNKLKAGKPKSTSKCEEVELKSYDIKKGRKYLKEIGLTEEDCDIVRLRQYTNEWETEKTAIAFRYTTCDFTKYRFITKEKKFRFRASGRFDSYYIAKLNSGNRVYITEAEKEAKIVSKYVDCSVLGISGTKLPDDTEHCLLASFEEIILMLDFDCWLDDKLDILGMYEKLRLQNATAKITVRPKLFCVFNGEMITEYDFGDLHKEGKLTSDIVETGLLSKDDIDCWKYREEYKRAGYDPENMIKKFEFLRR